MTARIPDSFNARPMGYPRWLLLTVNQNGKPNGGLAGMLDGSYISEARAKKITQEVADALFAPLVMVKEYRGAKRNPTLVHHGISQGAQYHLFTKAGAPLADLYVGEKAARAAAQALASFMGTPVHLVENDYGGTSGMNRGRPHGSPYHGPHEFELSPRARRNPQPAPKVGEKWASTYHGVGVITAVDPFRKRYQWRGQDGNRVWFDHLEWAGASFKPGRDTTRNPSALAPGDRVTATVYGVPREGTVVEQRTGGIVWVRWDGSPRKSWMHRESLAVVAANPSRTRTARYARAQRSASSRVPAAPYTSKQNRKQRRAAARKRAGVIGFGAFAYESQRHGARRAGTTSRNPGGPRIVYNRLLGGWFVVVGPHQTPIGGRYDTKAQAQASLGRRNPRRKGETVAAAVKRIERAQAAAYKSGDTAAALKAWYERKALAIEAQRRAGLSGPERNPRGSEVERARQTFEKWHEFDSHRITHMRGPDKRIPDTLVALGRLKSFVYESDKYTGKPTLYEHATKRPHPVLASDPSGRNTFIVGGRMKITGDGFVN